MKQEYEKAILNITPFDEEDVITTSGVDRNNAYNDINDLDESGGRIPVI